MTSTSKSESGNFYKVRRLISVVAEIIAAVLVLAEIAVLLANVIWRYGFNSPLVWTNELAGMLFLWLLSFGSVIALHRGEHMRMNAVVRMLGWPLQRLFARFSALVVIIFIVAVLVPSIGYMKQQQMVTTPTLQIPGSWEIAGEFVAFIFLLIIAVIQLFEDVNWKELVLTLAVGLGIGGGLWLFKSNLLDLGNINLIIFFVGLVGVCIICGVPIAFSFGIATTAYILFATQIPLSIIVSQMNQSMSAIELLAVPMFVVLGLLLEMTGVAKALVDFISALIGHMRGGLSYSLVGAMYLVSGISGSKAADQAAIAPVLLPEMKRRGGEPGELVAQLATAAAMSETIPPSLVLIVVGAVTGVSTAALFTAGLLPAGLAALALIIVIFFRSRQAEKSNVRPQARQIIRSFIIAIPSLFLPLLIRYAVLAGIATATEVATIGVAYTVIIGLFIYRRFDWRRIYPLLVETASLSGAILLIIGTASTMAWSLTAAGFASSLSAFMTHIPGGKIGFFGASIAMFIILGSVLEGLPAMVLFGPLLFPIAQEMGINVVQYAIVAILAMGIGLFMPPFGVGFYQSCLIGRTSTEQVLGRIWFYIAALIVALIVVAAVPWISVGLIGAGP